ncbi:MAG TPA: A/G-specific adenine glycosylase [Methylocella sp.]|nr:A/G-specific adenine glycosylase [Methylocella sp.]
MREKREPNFSHAALGGPAAAVLAWYDAHRRVLPWRAAPGERADPYRVWLSEVMLQQTTVIAVVPYFAAFLDRWPDLAALAGARQEDVLQAWAGLGYYSRARNLHACAQIVAGPLGGCFPETEAGLLALPGVGPYTAAAIAAIAFGQRAAAIDGNVLRLGARLFAIETPLPAARTNIKTRIETLVPATRPGDFAQALMDLGALICTPRHPSCEDCPLRASCLGLARGATAELPRRKARKARPLRQGAVFYMRRKDGAVLVRTRPSKGLLGGMAEFPGSAWEAEADEASWLAQAPLKAKFRKLDGAVEQVFTHFALRLFVYVADVAKAAQTPAGCRWTSAADLDNEAFPGVMRKVRAAVQSA